MNHFDVVVVGGGFAGIAAAISASRGGAKVLLIEKSNCLGGAAVNCLVNPFMPYTTSDPQNPSRKIMLSSGIFKEICSELVALTKELDGEKSEHIKMPISRFNEEYLKIVLNRMILKEHIEVLFHTSVISVDCKNNHICSVRISNISGLTDINAEFFIDCTGNADLVSMAGFQTRIGRQKDHLCQPMTLCFRVGNIDINTFYNNEKMMQEKYKELQKAGKIHNIREDVLVFLMTNDKVIHFNTTRVIKYNPVDALDVTKAEIEAREQVYEMFSFLKNYIPGCENACLLSTAMHIGVRESRMIVGEYTLTQEDLVNCTKFSDGVAACNYDIDIHNPDGSGTSHYYFEDGTYYTIPYRCLIPKGATNLLTAGRCISSTHEAQASYRIMPVVCTLGEAAGTAAAIAFSSCKDIKKVNRTELQNTLRKNGAFIGE